MVVPHDDVNIFTQSGLECKYIYVSWRDELGKQIRKARIAAGLSQLQLAERTSVKREHISNIELGKNSPAVKIITDIAHALSTSFYLDGCRIEPELEHPVSRRPVPVPQQMRLDFGVEYRFSASSVLLNARSEDEIELRAVFFK
jgi:transcriptional regulator with XRE-family HTH domain